jgi:FtsZ-binding cell division protein ZapB
MNDALDRSLPPVDPASSVPDSAAPDEEAPTGAPADEDESQEGEDPRRMDDDLDPSEYPAAYRDTMRRLHRRVAQAVDTIEELRAENERLRERIEQLEERPVLPDDKAVLTLDDDPEALRSRVTDFIDAIDAYLEATAPDEEAEPTSSPSED